MYDDNNFMDYVATNGIGGVMAGAYEGMHTYSDKKTVLENNDLFVWMMKDPIRWIDTGYLTKEKDRTNPRNPSIYKFTAKVGEDRLILLRLMEKHND